MAAPGEEWLAEPGPDGRKRCWWCLGSEEMTAYHDEEWGRPLHGDVELFERLSLEAFQSGLSWLTILRKRKAFRAAFEGFDPAKVASYGPSDVARLLGDAGIVRNRRKIEATIANAGALLELQASGAGLDELIWSFAPTPTRGPPRAPGASSRARPTSRRPSPRGSRGGDSCSSGRPPHTR